MLRSPGRLAAVVFVLVAVGPQPARARDQTPSGATAQPPAAPAENPEPPLSVGGIFKKYPSDVKRFWSKENAVSLGIGGGFTALAHIWDDNLRKEVSRNSQLNEILEPGNTYGSFYLQTGLAFGTYVLGRTAGRPHLAVVSADIVRAQFLGQTYVQLIKLAVRRERPDGSKYSFPSGHSTTAFATASVLQRHYGYKIGIPAYTLAAYVGGARIAGNRHYLSDVIFGAAVGFASGHTVIRGHAKRSLEVKPVVTPGGFALAVTFGPSGPTTSP
jgi:hypothetical protein